MADKTEARLATIGSLILAGLCLASVISPTIEDFLNFWVTLIALILGGGYVGVAIVRSAWQSVLLWWELGVFDRERV